MNDTVSRRVVLSAVATGLLATGCTSPRDKPAAGATSPLPVRPAGVTVVSGSFDGQAPPAGDGLLRTPHSTHWLESFALRTEVQGPEAQQLGLSAFSVEPGHEIVIASFKKPGPPAYSGKAKATVLVAAGQQMRPVDLFGPYDPKTRSYRELRSQTVVACVPVGTPVELRATDAGRTASLDLRTGKRGADASLPSAYSPAPAPGQSYRATGLIVTRPSGKFKVPTFSAPNLGVPDLIWAVPDTFTRGVLRIAPHGSLTVDYANASVPAAWKQLPQAREFPVAISA